MANALNRDIKAGEQVIVLPEYLVPGNENIEQRIFIVSGGFGCLPMAMGQKIFGRFADERKNTFILGFWISVDETEEWQKHHPSVDSEEIDSRVG